MKLRERLSFAIDVAREPNRHHENIFIHPFKGLRTVNRIEYLLANATRKRIVHFGFLDSPFLEEKIKARSMLHLKLKDVASAVYGVDINHDDLEIYRQLTQDQNNLIFDISEHRADVDVLSTQQQDFIFFPEVLEHIGNPALALENLRRVCLATNAKLVITVPNAFALTGVVEAAAGSEIVHPDHFFYFSPATLSRLVTCCGFVVDDILLYCQRSEDEHPGLTAAGVICVCKPTLSV